MRVSMATARLRPRAALRSGGFPNRVHRAAHLNGVRSRDIPGRRCNVLCGAIGAVLDVGRADRGSTVRTSSKSAGAGGCHGLYEQHGGAL
jgi:hypothetical protein